MSNSRASAKPGASAPVGEATTQVRTEVPIVDDGLRTDVLQEQLLPNRARGTLHTVLLEQLQQARKRSIDGEVSLEDLIPLLDGYYRQLDEERRGIVRSMQLMSHEALGVGRDASRETTAFMRTILDNIKEAVITLNADGVIETFNPTGERLFGYAAAEVIGHRLDRIMPTLSRPDSVANNLRRLAGAGREAHGSVGQTDLQGRAKGGAQFPVEMTVSQVSISRRDLFIVSIRDSSERQRSQRQLRESEERYRILVDNAPEAIVVVDLATQRFVDVNKNAERFFRRSREELLQLGFVELGDPERRGAELMLDTLFENALHGEPQVFEWVYRDASAHDLPCEVRLVRLPSADQRLLRASITDVGDRKRATAFAIGERAVYEKITVNAPLADVFTSITELVETVNPQVVCGISLLSEGGGFESVVAPGLPGELRRRLAVGKIDVRDGSCAAAVFLGRQVLVADVASDAFWQHHREHLQKAGIRSSWSTPIRGESGKVLGSLGVYRQETGLPGKRDLEVLANAAQLAAIAIERRRSGEALSASEARYRGLFESVLEGMYQCDRDGRLLAANPALVQMLGYSSAQDLYRLPSMAAVYWNPREHRQFVAELAAHRSIHNAEHQLRRSDGEKVVVLESARAVFNDKGELTGFEGSLSDITARTRAEQAVFAEKERAQVTLNSIGDAVITTDGQGAIDYLNPVAEQLIGWRFDEAFGRSIDDVLRLRDEVSRLGIDNPLRRALTSGARISATTRTMLVTRDGAELAIQETAAPILDRTGAIIGAVMVFNDVTRERRLRRALAYEAAHDALTGLINRREFDSRLQGAVDDAARSGGRHALLYIDLDQFKVINDTCGHGAGDRLIREITSLIQNRLRAEDTIARLGGDEFGVLLHDLGLEQAGQLAETLRQSIANHRFEWQDQSMSIGASIGVVEISSSTESAASALSAADVACYSAKDLGRNRVQLYGGESGQHRHREMQWVSKVTSAVEQNRLELVTQPIVAIHQGAGLSNFHELTVRLRDADGNLVMPNEFIPAAERYNVMLAIDKWVVRQAAQLLLHNRAKFPQLLLAVNLSGSSINQDGFLDFVLEVVGEGDTGSGICFELTETAAVANLHNAVAFMQELKLRGCRFSLDDFGIGLSSFMYLKTLPVDFLKIDGEFVARITDDAVDRSMVEAICKVGHELGIATVAERVESGAVLTELERIGIDYAQGFHIARPVPVASTFRL